MAIKQKDRNRAELVKAIIKQNGGRIFTVVAKRKSPKRYFIITELTENAPVGVTFPITSKIYLNTKKNQKLLDDIKEGDWAVFTEHEEHFMTMTCRTGVKKDLKGGKSTIADKPNLISVNLTDGKGYRCFSAYNVLELRASGTVIKFKEEDVLAFEGE